MQFVKHFKTFILRNVGVLPKTRCFTFRRLIGRICRDWSIVLVQRFSRDARWNSCWFGWASSEMADLCPDFFWAVFYRRLTIHFILLSAWKQAVNWSQFETGTREWWLGTWTGQQQNITSKWSWLCEQYYYLTETICIVRCVHETAYRRISCQYFIRGEN